MFKTSEIDEWIKSGQASETELNSKENNDEYI